LGTVNFLERQLHSAELVDILKLDKKSTNACWYTDPDSGEIYECRERIRTDIEPKGRLKLKEVKPYITLRSSLRKNPVLLWTYSMGPLDSFPAVAQNFPSSSMQAGYKTASSRPQTLSLPLRTEEVTVSSTAAASANYTDTCYSAPPVDN